MRKSKTAPTAVPVVPLFKVVMPDGSAPYHRNYKWSLPTQALDGTWAPGAWHEETPKCIGKGLHLTPIPSDVITTERVAYLVECDGVVGDPMTDRQVLAARVRLLRVAPDAELYAASEAWSAAYHVRARTAENKARLDKARTAATARSKELAAERAAGIDSPAMVAFKTLIELTPTESWRDANTSRSDALKYITDYLRFNPTDVGEILRKYNGGYWLGENGAEGHYASAVSKGNLSACVAWETYMGRKPWWTLDHRSKVKRRVCVGDIVWVDGAWHNVNSFRDDYINTRRQNDKKLVKITRAQLLPKA